MSAKPHPPLEPPEPRSWMIRQLLRAAQAGAQTRGRPAPAEVDLVLAMLDEPESILAQALAGLVPLEAVRERIAELFPVQGDDLQHFMVTDAEGHLVFDEEGVPLQRWERRRRNPDGTETWVAWQPPSKRLQAMRERDRERFAYLRNQGEPGTL